MSNLLRQWMLPAFFGLAIGGLIVALWTVRGQFAIFPPSSEGRSEARPGYAAAVSRAAPSVVNIYSRVRELPPMCQRDPRLQPWCDRLMGADRTSLGSGVIVHPSGYIVTNAHVIEGASEILVMLADGRTTQAELIGSDALTDLAVVRISANGLIPITLGSSADVAVGDVALAIGNPFGIGQTVSAGIISAKGRASVSSSPYDDFLQTDAAINPGNSGGALIDAEGRLIGINTLIVSPTGDSIGVGFALPAALAYSILEEIIDSGQVTRGWLGLTLENPTTLGGRDGIRVSGVERAGPAARAGLRPLDLIIAVNDEPANDPNRFSRAVGRTKPGEQIHLQVLRADPTDTPTNTKPPQTLAISVIAAKRPES